ncbi:hypothetical protein AAE478_001288 [Parahypoxylon ruwenzoriense]
MASETKNSTDQSLLTRQLLSRAHSPDTASRIFADKIQHRPLFLRPSSPPPSNAREARRAARRAKQLRAQSLRPKPVSARQRRSLGLYTVPKSTQKYAVYEPLHRLWVGYIHEVLGPELYTGGTGAAAKLAAADYHGAAAEVSRSSCPSRVGIRGIVIKDSRFAFEIITEKNKVKTVPKEGTMFRISVAAPDDEKGGDEGEEKGRRQKFTFEIHGDQFQYRSADRANKKFKQHYLKKL